MNLYFDNASTSFPKPKEVGEYINLYLSQGGTYGRAAYPRVFSSSKVVEETREILSKIVGTSLISNIIFTYNSTHALNTLIQGFRYKHKQILVSPLEHNAVGRPIEYLRQNESVAYGIMPHYSDGLINLEELKKVNLSKIDLVIVNHISNVNGLIQPIKDIKQIIGEIPLIVDASQSLGKVSINVDEWGIDMLAFTGHKGLMGPTGIGGFFIRDENLVRPLIFGGTGSNSDKLLMPDYCPDKFEAGTQNIMGIYGLYGGLKHQPKLSYNIDTYKDLLLKLSQINNLKLLIANKLDNQSDVFSIVPLKTSVSNFTKKLYDIFKIEVRGGLHCSPIAHQTFKTYPQGALRVSLSNYHTDNDLNYLLNCILDINERTNNG